MLSHLAHFTNWLLSHIGLRIVRDSTFAKLQQERSISSPYEQGDRPKDQTSADIGYVAKRKEFPLLLGRIETFEEGVGRKLEEMREIFQEDTNRRLLEIQDAQLDLLRLERERQPVDQERKLHIVTNHPLAIYSDDFKFPRGAKNDNTRHPRFVRKCQAIFGRKITHLDLGCAGGGLVWDFLLDGHRSYGIEGSDLPLLEQRGQWRLLRENLCTADITEPFKFEDVRGCLAQFDVITAWEVLEHIPGHKLDRLFENIVENLRPDGLFVASVATFEDHDSETGAVYHVSVHPKEWWLARIAAAGMEVIEGLFAHRDYVRGAANPRAHDWDALTNPDLGFHLVCRRNMGGSR